jgi:putative OPT family oligopeptide transporter
MMAVESKTPFQNGSVSILSIDMARKEITVRVVILSIILAIILGGANVYLGLFAGLTVSASIPAAIISMSVLRTIYGNDVDILENNLVQTAASAGESLAAGVIFTFPALVMMNENDDDHLELKGWSHFKYTETVILAICGGFPPSLTAVAHHCHSQRGNGNHVQHSDSKSTAC